MSTALKRKYKTLFTNPRGVAIKYSRKFWARLTGHRASAFDEDYNKHWRYVSFVGKTVLDLGADYGSTADYFLANGARRVIAVEGNKELACKLHRNFGNDKRVACVQKWIASGKDISKLIEKYAPDIVKVDIEGEEKRLLDIGVETLAKVKEWLVETHTEQLYRIVKDFFVQNKFKIFRVEYGKVLDVPEIKVLIAVHNEASQPANNVSIVIPTLTGKIATLQYLPAYPEIIVVKGLSATKARNFGAKTSKGAFLIFMDDDIKFNRELIKQIISMIKPNTIVTLNGTSRIMAVRRSDFQSLGGFDENIPYCIWEEIEFFWRAKTKGFHFINLDNSLVTHLGKHPVWKKRFFQIFNSTYVYLKHGYWHVLICANPLWLLVRWLSLIYWLPILTFKSKKFYWLNTAKV
jgi:precorrin-6B methylase 2